MGLTSGEFTVEYLRDLVQDAHLSFLLGAGTSAPMFRVLGDIENILAATDDSDLDVDQTAYVRASVLATFFVHVVQKNQDLLANSGEASALLPLYEGFLQTINRVVLERRSSVLNKQVNVFTTNVDLATEIAAERLQVHLNDGFGGRLRPRFSTSNFGTVVSRRSLQYDNLSEVPTFNLLKLHGSVGWATQAIEGTDRTEIVLDTDLANISTIQEHLDPLDPQLLQVETYTTFESLAAADTLPQAAEVCKPFLDAYDQLAIVNPTKTKFQHTVLNQNYYDLLRLFSNELEKANSVLFVIGFSCRDEHIRELMVRAARVNPTLQIVVFAYDPRSVADIEKAFAGYPITNSNIQIVGPTLAEPGEDQVLYDLETITTEFFAKVAPARAPAAAANAKMTLEEMQELIG